MLKRLLRKWPGIFSPYTNECYRVPCRGQRCTNAYHALVIIQVVGDGKYDSGFPAQGVFIKNRLYITGLFTQNNGFVIYFINFRFYICVNSKTTRMADKRKQEKVDYEAVIIFGVSLVVIIFLCYRILHG